MRLFKLIFVLLLAAVLTSAWTTAGESWVDKKMHMIDFTEDPALRWYIVNDGVMGGVSTSGMTATTGQTGIFSGNLSLANNGGFASVRLGLADPDFSLFRGVELRVKGDGRTYQLRFRTNDRLDGVAYRSSFTTEDGQWLTVQLPFAEFEPTFRGRILPDQPPLDPGKLAQLVLMVADKKAGSFSLEVDFIRAWQPEEI